MLRRTVTTLRKQDVPLQVEHIHPRAHGGTNRASNLTIACESCNLKKGTQSIEEFLKGKPDVLKKILAQAKSPLLDAAAVTATRWALYARLKMFELPVECGSGGLTKYNRTQRNLPKAHWCDAACVGVSTPSVLSTEAVVPLLITASGHGNRQMCGTNKYGFPIRHRQRQKHHYGYQTSDMVRAVVTSGKKGGEYVGRVLTRASGSFDIRTKQGRVQGISHRFCTPLQRSDGYSYQKGEVA